MKTSLIIPCTPNHFINNLVNTLKSYEEDTVRPDEVIVSLSQYNLLDKNCLTQENLEYLQKCFSNKIFENFKLLRHADLKTHGPNRQAGSEIASNELLIYGDADDLALPQRIEIIKYFFENHDIVHLNHQWIGNINKSKSLKPEEIKFISSQEIYNHYFPNKSLDDCIKISLAYGGDMLTYITAGHVSIRRDNLKNVKWKDSSELSFGPAEDYEFNMENLYYFNKSMLINAPLIEYSNAGGLSDSFGEYYDIL